MSGEKKGGEVSWRRWSDAPPGVRGADVTDAVGGQEAGGGKGSGTQRLRGGAWIFSCSVSAEFGWKGWVYRQDGNGMGRKGEKAKLHRFAIT